MKSVVKVKGKQFIVTDPFNNKSYALNNKLDAESLCGTLNEAAFYKEGIKDVHELVNGLLEVKFK